MTEREVRGTRMSRREAMRMLAAGAGLGSLASGGRIAGAGAGAGTGTAAGTVTTAPQAAEQAATLTFPEGAIVRTVLADVDPQELGGGATLFHEHLSFAYSTPPPEPRRPGTPEPEPPTRRSAPRSEAAIGSAPLLPFPDGQQQHVLGQLRA